MLGLAHRERRHCASLVEGHVFDAGPKVEDDALALEVMAKVLENAHQPVCVQVFRV